MENKIIYRSIVIIIILGLAVYANSLNGKFIWDDEPLVKYNLHLRSWSGIPKIFTQDLGAGTGREYNFYRPLQIFSYRIDYCLWRLEAQGYHLTNILLHILTALAIYWLVNILYDNRLLSLFTGAFFVVHPVHTEAVAYISGRADSLALLFMLLSLIFYIKHLRFKKTSVYILSVLSYILALSSRESSLIVPLLLLLYHYTFGKRVAVKRFLPILMVTLLYVVFRVTALSSVLPDLSPYPPLIQRIPTFFVAMTDYVGLLLLPLNLHMEYGSRLFNFGDLKVITGILIMAALLIYVFKKRRAKGLVFFSISWFLVTLLPVSHVYPLNAYMAEHWLYLPSIGFFLVLAKGFAYIYRAKNFRMFAIVFIITLLAFYSYLTIRQNDYWKEPISFYKKTLEYAPDSSRIHNNLGIAYGAIGKYEDAIISYQKALEFSPDYVNAHYNLGTAYDAIGKREEEAIAAYKKAIELDPDYSAAYNNLGNIYSNMGRNDEAMALYEKATEINPDYKDAHYNLGNEYRGIGRNKEAIASYKKAIELDPYDAATHNNLAVAYYYEDQYELAVKHCDRAIELGFRVHPEFLKNLEPYR